MKEALINSASATAARDAAFTELTTTNGNISTKLSQQEDNIRAVQAELCKLKVVSATRTTNEKEKNKGVHTYARNKKQKPQCQTNPTKKKYNNIIYFWYHGYDTCDPHKSQTCKIAMFDHKKEATRCDPMGKSQNIKSYIWNKERNICGGYDQQHMTLNCIGRIKNGLENTYVCRNIARAPTTKTHKEKIGKFCSRGFRIHGKSHGSIFPPKKYATKKRLSMKKSPNGNIIRSTMESGLDLTILPNT